MSWHGLLHILDCSPSGSTAVVICNDVAGHTITVYSVKGKVLAVFDTRGVGGTCYRSGQPWLVTTIKVGVFEGRSNFPSLQYTSTNISTCVCDDLW